MKKALIIGASSGVGLALSNLLITEGWNVVMTARRIDKLLEIQKTLGTSASVYEMDVDDVARTQVQVDKIWAEHGKIDLVIVSAGTGFVNPQLAWNQEEQTIKTNVLGFTSIAQCVMKLFAKQGYGHLAGISSIAKYMGGGEAPAYGASKAYMSLYLDGLRSWAKKQKLPIVVTELCPGFIDTAMMQTDKPFWVASPEKAAKQMLDAIKKGKKHAFITKRWAIIAFLLRMLPKSFL